MHFDILFSHAYCNGVSWEYKLFYATVVVLKTLRILTVIDFSTFYLKPLQIFDELALTKKKKKKKTPFDLDAALGDSNADNADKDEGLWN